MWESVIPETDSLLEVSQPTMAEGTVPGLEAADLEESVATTDRTVLEAVEPAKGIPMVVRPKERKATGPEPLKGQEALDAGQGGTEGCWLGPSGAMDCRATQDAGPVLTPSGAHFSQWRECRISEDEWSYSTAVDSQTMDMLQEMFGAVGFRGPGQSRGWQDSKAGVRHPLEQQT